MSEVGRPIRPIITGTPHPPAAGKRPVQQPANAAAFGDLLRARLDPGPAENAAVTLSRHAQIRAEQRGITLSEADFEKLGTAVTKAGDKGIVDTLVLMNSTAFIVNVPSRVVVTMVDPNDNATVISNINGAVIV